MNAVEIEEAVAALVAEPFEPEEFPYDFLAAFGNKKTAIKRLRKGTSNKTDVDGAVLYRNNVHLKTCAEGEATETLAALAASPAAKKQKAKYALATDGVTVEAQRLGGGAVLACDYDTLHHEFTFFLPLAGITTVQQIPESEVDVKATVQLNKLYVELLRENPDWDAADRREELNHFMARLIFCLFAEDTGIFLGDDLFTATVTQMTAYDGSDTHAVLAELFRAMNVKPKDREAAGVKSWAQSFPYVNGGLFSGDPAAPRFSKVARSYLIHVGRLNWTKINPDIFGSMIQAVADDEERGALGMHYTSVPNIRKVLDPLFLDELWAKLDEAGDGSDAGSKRKLYNLRERIKRIRVFDPACGSGNFLVIAYKQMRAIEAKINARRGERGSTSIIPLTNFRGIELRHFSCEIARLALVIAEYQCDVLHRGEKLALAEFLPLDAKNWITCDNALRLNWVALMDEDSRGVRLAGDRLFDGDPDQAKIGFENDGGETYICGNPPYKGSKSQTAEQKADLEAVFGASTNWRSLDYVTGWFLKAAKYARHANSAAAFVATNSICQGIQVPTLWPLIIGDGYRVIFAHTSFKWANLASHNAGVTVVVVGMGRRTGKVQLMEYDGAHQIPARRVDNINGYLVSGPDVYLKPAKESVAGSSYMDLGNMPKDGGNLLLSEAEAEAAVRADPSVSHFLHDFIGSQEFVRGTRRKCLWIEDDEVELALESPLIKQRLEGVRQMRSSSRAASTRAYADRPHRFKQIQGVAAKSTIIVPGVSSARRAFLQVGLLPPKTIVSNLAFAIYDAPLWNVALIASRLHLVWIATVCGRLKTDYRYGNKLGWNTFPVPPLTERNKADLTRCAEEIVLAREAHWPATIADLYDPDAMPEDLRAAHDRNDETLERIYIGRRFKNDTERLETLFDLYAKMTAEKDAA